MTKTTPTCIVLIEPDAHLARRGAEQLAPAFPNTSVHVVGSSEEAAAWMEGRKGVVITDYTGVPSLVTMRVMGHVRQICRWIRSAAGLKDKVEQNETSIDKLEGDMETVKQSVKTIGDAVAHIQEDMRKVVWIVIGAAIVAVLNSTFRVPVGKPSVMSDTHHPPAAIDRR